MHDKILVCFRNPAGHPQFIRKADTEGTDHLEPPARFLIVREGIIQASEIGKPGFEAHRAVFQGAVHDDRYRLYNIIQGVNRKTAFFLYEGKIS